MRIILLIQYADSFVDRFNNTRAMLTIDTSWQLCLHYWRTLLLSKDENNRDENRENTKELCWHNMKTINVSYRKDNWTDTIWGQYTCHKNHKSDDFTWGQLYNVLHNIYPVFCYAYLKVAVSISWIFWLTIVYRKLEKFNMSCLS